ncbi:MAG: ABC transporter substrate-binding protein [Chloroflexi bacterium]|nr:ABC transporter substrate-binding protein [Chloroflexota bacterium]
MLKRTVSFLTIIMVLFTLLAACGDNTPTTASGGATTAAVAGSGSTTAATGSATVASVATTGVGATATPAGKGVLTLGNGTTSTFSRNFNPFVSSPLFLTMNTIYEPLMIYNTVKGELMPWLATGYKWSADNKQLTFTLQNNVKWSDGQPFTAKDVAFTFNLFKNKPGLQGPSLVAMTGNNAYVESVTATDDTTVVFNFKQVFTPGLYDIIGQMIVPEHIWKDVADPSKATNDNPVGTGPFTQVTNFQSQAYQVDKNPNYWQPGKPYFQSIRMLAFGSNDAFNLALANGQIDWASTYIPKVEDVYVAKKPANYGYWFPLTGQMVVLALNLTKKPFDDVNVRKAISYALNRQQMATVAESGYTKPADVTGLAEGQPKFKVADPTKLGDWTNYNVAKANQLLDAAGLKKGSNGMRTLPDGTPLKFTLSTVNGFTDWIAASQIIVQNLKAVGIDVSVTQTDAAAWIGLRQKGQFDMTISLMNGSNPYIIYRNAMSNTLLKPVGEATVAGNFERYSGGKADDLLTQFAGTSDEAKQKEIAGQLQQVFADEAPLLPLFPLPQWYEYNTTNFEGFPTKDNPYIAGQRGDNSQDGTSPILPIITTIKPK